MAKKQLVEAAAIADTRARAGAEAFCLRQARPSFPLMEKKQKINPKQKAITGFVAYPYLETLLKPVPPTDATPIALWLTIRCICGYC